MDKSYVVALAEAFVGYRGMSFEQVIQVFEDSVSFGGDGSRTILLEVVQEKMKLPEGFFSAAIGEGVLI